MAIRKAILKFLSPFIFIGCLLGSIFSLVEGFEIKGFIDDNPDGPPIIEGDVDDVEDKFFTSDVKVIGAVDWFMEYSDKDNTYYYTAETNEGEYIIIETEVGDPSGYYEQGGGFNSGEYIFEKGDSIDSSTDRNKIQDSAGGKYPIITHITKNQYEKGAYESFALAGALFVISIIFGVTTFFLIRNYVRSRNKKNLVGPEKPAPPQMPLQR